MTIRVTNIAIKTSTYIIVSRFLEDYLPSVLGEPGTQWM
jgi:hypothetical protein